MKARQLILSAALGLAGCFQYPSRPPDAENEAYFRKVEHEWLTFAPSQRRALLSEIIAEDFVGFTKDGRTLNKPQEIAFYSSLAPADPGALEAVSFAHFGDVVLVRAQAVPAKSSGTPDRRTYMHLWMFRYGKWWIIASQEA